MSTTGKCLQLDVGNSSAKWRLVQGNAATARGVYRSDDPASEAALLGSTDAVQEIWISSVAAPADSRSAPATRTAITVLFICSSFVLRSLTPPVAAHPHPAPHRWPEPRAAHEHHPRITRASPTISDCRGHRATLRARPSGSGTDQG